MTGHKQSSLYVLGRSNAVFLEDFQRDLSLTSEAASDFAHPRAKLVIEPILGKLMGRGSSEELAPKRGSSRCDG